MFAIQWCRRRERGRGHGYGGGPNSGLHEATMRNVFKHTQMPATLTHILTSPTSYVLISCNQGYHRTPATCMLVWIYLYVPWQWQTSLLFFQTRRRMLCLLDAKICGCEPILWIPSCTTRGQNWSQEDAWQSMMKEAVHFHKRMSPLKPEERLVWKVCSLFMAT